MSKWAAVCSLISESTVKQHHIQNSTSLLNTWIQALSSENTKPALCVEIWHSAHKKSPMQDSSLIRRMPGCQTADALPLHAGDWLNSPYRLPSMALAQAVWDGGSFLCSNVVSCGYPHLLPNNMLFQNTWLCFYVLDLFSLPETFCRVGRVWTGGVDDMRMLSVVQASLICDRAQNPASQSLVSKSEFSKRSLHQHSY